MSVFVPTTDMSAASELAELDARSLRLVRKLTAKRKFSMMVTINEGGTFKAGGNQFHAISVSGPSQLCFHTRVLPSAGECGMEERAVHMCWLLCHIPLHLAATK